MYFVYSIKFFCPAVLILAIVGKRGTAVGSGAGRTDQRPERDGDEAGAGWVVSSVAWGMTDRRRRKPAERRFGRQLFPFFPVLLRFLYENAASGVAGPNGP